MILSFLCFSTISALDLLPVLSGSRSTLEVGFRKVSNFERFFKILLQLCYTTIHMHSFTVYQVIVCYMYIKLCTDLLFYFASNSYMYMFMFLLKKIGIFTLHV